MYRTLGRSGIEVSAMGLGCFAIGGPWTWSDGRVMGWAQADEIESKRTIQAAFDAGITFFDTAANYGAGHSERLLGQVLGSRRHDVVIATKFGCDVDEERKQVSAYEESIIDYVREDCERSLERLGTDYIDLFQIHVDDVAPERIPELIDILEELVVEGKIRGYGWSTDSPTNAAQLAEGEHCTAVQHGLNVLANADEMLTVCDDHKLASINKRPLGSGILTGKYSANTVIEDPLEWRHQVDFSEPSIAGYFDRLEAIRDVLISKGHSLPQAAIAYNWAYHDRAIPIPGARSVEQVQENAGALELGPLSDEQLQAISDILAEISATT